MLRLTTDIRLLIRPHLVGTAVSQFFRQYLMFQLQDLLAVGPLDVLRSPSRYAVNRWCYVLPIPRFGESLLNAPRVLALIPGPAGGSPCAHYCPFVQAATSLQSPGQPLLGA